MNKFLLLILISITSSTSLCNEGQFRPHPLGLYLILRPYIVEGSITKVNGFRMKIKVSTWLKGNRNRKKIRPWHNNIINDTNQAKHEFDSIIDKPYVFLLRGKHYRPMHLSTRREIFFEIINDSINIPSPYFNVLRDIKEEHESLANHLRKEGIRISLAYFKSLITNVNRLFVTNQKHSRIDRFSYYYQEQSIILDDFTALIVNDLKSGSTK